MKKQINNMNNTSKQNNIGPYPEPGQVWRHYKGGKYQIVAMCNHTDTNEVLVIYKSLSFGGVYARPYSEWHDKVLDPEFGNVKVYTNRFNPSV